MKLANVIKRFVAGIVFKEGAAPDSPEAGDRHLYATNDGIYEKDSDGNIKGPLGVDTQYVAGDGLEEDPAGTFKVQARDGEANTRGTISVHSDGIGVDLGTGNTDAAVGSHGHGQLHDRQHDILSSDDHGDATTGSVTRGDIGRLCKNTKSWHFWET